MDTDNNLLWNSLSDSRTKLEYSLSSILLFIMLILNGLLLFNKESSKRSKFGIFKLVIILATAAFLSIYTTVGVVSSTIKNDDETTEASDDRYTYMFAAIGASMPLFAAFLSILFSIYIKAGLGEKYKIDNVEFNASNILYFSLLYGGLAYSAFSVIYVIYDMYKGNNFFPLSSKNFKENNDSKLNLDAILASILIPLIFFVFSLVGYIIFKVFRQTLFTDTFIYIFLGLTILSAVIYISLYFTKNLEDKLTNYIFLFSVIGLLVTTIFLLTSHYLIRRYYKDGGYKISTDDSERYLNYFIGISSSALILWSIAASLSYSFGENNLDNDKEYSIYLVSTTVAIIFSIIGSLLFLIFTRNSNLKKRIEDKNTDFKIIFWIFFSLALAGFGLSVTNLFMASGQSIKNNSELDNTNYENFNEIQYELLNLGTNFGYLSSGLITFIILAYMTSMYLEKGKDEYTKEIKKFLLRKGENNKSFNFLFIIFFSGLVALLSYYISYYSTTSDKDEHDFTKAVSLPAIVLLVLGLVESGVNFYRDEKNRSTLFPKLYNILFIVILFGLPITSLLMYVFSNPTFYRKLNDGGSKTLIFGNTVDKKSLAIDHNTLGDNSIFNVKSNFANYGNGLLVAGGESNLDIESTRGILYVDNQGGYFNFKYLDSELNSFDSIVKENNVNLFTLAANDISFGTPNTPYTDAFWVAVGENVGLTDSVNNSIFYNIKAGANSLTTIPDIKNINDWEPATSSFSYRGNGVVAGSIGGNNRWVAVGQDFLDYPLAGEAFNTIKYSNDGITWSNANGVSFSSYGNKVAFSPAGLDNSSGTATDRFVAVGYDYINNNNIIYSNDGIAWLSTTGANFSQEGKDVAYGLSGNGTSGIWVAVGVDDTNPIKYSINGGTVWNNADGVSLTNEEGAIAVSYNLSKNRFEVVGKSNKTTTSSFMYTSTNGSSWAPADTKFESIIQGTAITYNRGLCVSVANYGNQYDKIYYPKFDNNKYFFVKKRNNEALDTFSYIFYGSLIAMTLFLYLTIFLLKPIENNTATTDATGTPATAAPT